MRFSSRAVIFQLSVVWICGLLSAAQAVPLKIERAIIFPDGKPAAGAKVLARSLNTKDGTLKDEKRIIADDKGIARGEIEVDPDDAFSPIRTTGYLVVDAPGMALTFEDFNNWHHWAPDLVQPIRLGVGHEITGKILDADKQPVAGALVTLAAFNTQWFNWRVNYPSANILTPEASTQSGADGAFTLRPVLVVGRSGEASGGSPILVARAAHNGATLSGAAHYYPSDKSEFVLRVAPTSVVRGRLTNSLDGSPVAGAKVKLIAYPGAEIEATVTPVQTGPDGAFVFEEVGPQRQLFATATHPDYGNGWTFVQSQQGDPKAAGFEDVKIEMRPLANVQGRVLDVKTGAPPITPTSILAIYGEGFNDGNISVGSYSLSSRMNADGTFSMKMPVGHNHVRVRGAGYWEGGYDHPIDLEIQPGDNKNLVFEVRRENGFLTQFSTRAAEDAQKAGVKDYDFDRDFDVQMRGKDGKVATTNAGMIWYWPLYKPEDTLDVRVIKIVDGVLQEVVPWTKLAPGRDDDSPANWPRRINVPSRQTMTISGQAVDALSGKPLAGVTIHLVTRPESVGKKLAPVTTDAAGRWSFSRVLMPREILVQAEPPPAMAASYLTGWARVKDGEFSAVASTGDEGQQVIGDVRVALPPLYLVKGKLIDAQTGQPPAYVGKPALLNFFIKSPITPLVLHDAQPNERPLYVEMKPVSTPIAADGSFEVRLPAGQHAIGLNNIHALMPESQSVTISNVQDLELKVQRRAAIAVRIKRSGDEKKWLLFVDGEYVHRLDVIDWGETNVYEWSWPGGKWGGKIKIGLQEEKSHKNLYSGELVADPNIAVYDIP
jgi:hypothetical protein